MAQRGMVAFFDILGYQDIIDNNLIEEVAKIISDILLKLPSGTKERLLAELIDEGEYKEVVKNVLDSIGYRVISDSLLLVCEIPEDKKKFGKLYWGYLGVCCYPSFRFF